MTDQPPPGGSTAAETPAKPACQATARHGGQCRAWARPGSTFCETHDPERRALVHERRVRGGKVSAFRNHRRRLHTIRELVRYGGEKLLDLEEGHIGLDLARGIFYGLAVQAKLVELAQVSDLERRMATIEAALADQPKERRQWVA